MDRTQKLVYGTLLLCLVTLGRGIPLAAQEEPAVEPEATREVEEVEGAPSLPATEAQDFLGAWKVALDVGGTPLQVTLSLRDSDGKVTALLDSPQGRQEITEITKSDDGLNLAFDSMFGRLSLAIRLHNDELVGRLAAETGGFEAPLTATRTTEEVAVTPAAGRGRNSLFGRASPETRLKLEDRAIVIRYPEPTADGKEFAQIAGLEPGDVVQFPAAAAIKLRTDLALKFGGTLIETGNLSPNYPGTYSLWLKKVADGWHLVFNQEGDVWGTQHDPAFDRAEVPTVIGTVDEPAEKLQWKLSRDAEGGVLKVAWGEHQWTARFQILE